MKTVSLLFAFFFLGACASTKEAENKIQQKVSQETSVSDGPSLEFRIRDLIQSSKTLSDAKKIELEGLLSQTRGKTKALLEQSFKLRSVLVQELISGSVDYAQVKQLKKDIKKVESLRIQNSLQMVDGILNIVEGDPGRQAIADHLIYFDRNFH